jgi:hypothetical protein
MLVSMGRVTWAIAGAGLAACARFEGDSTTTAPRGDADAAAVTADGGTADPAILFEDKFEEERGGCANWQSFDGSPTRVAGGRTGFACKWCVGPSPDLYHSLRAVKPLPVVAGDMIYIEAYVHADTGEADMGTAFLRGTLFSNAPRTRATMDWQPVSHTFTADQAGDILPAVRLKLTASGSSACVLVDDVLVRKQR